MKKKPSSRPSAKVKVAVAGSAQSAAERRLAEAELRALIAKFAPAQLRLIGTARRQLRKRLPSAHELVYEYRDAFVTSFSPTERGYEGVLAIRGGADGVKLYFNQGKELSDPAKLLQGSGNQTRWIQLEGAKTLARPEVASLIEAAIAGNRVPFPEAGRGSMIVRATTAKKRHSGRLSTTAKSPTPKRP